MTIHRLSKPLDQNRFKLALNNTKDHSSIDFDDVIITTYSSIQHIEISGSKNQDDPNVSKVE